MRIRSAMTPGPQICSNLFFFLLYFIFALVIIFYSGIGLFLIYHIQVKLFVWSTLSLISCNFKRTIIPIFSSLTLDTFRHFNYLQKKLVLGWGGIKCLIESPVFSFSQHHGVYIGIDKSV